MNKNQESYKKRKKKIINHKQVCFSYKNCFSFPMLNWTGYDL